MTGKLYNGHVKDWCQGCRQNQCPVCLKPDWCLIAKDGNACICARIQSNQRVGDAGWLHKNENNYLFSLFPTIKKPQVPQQALLVSPAELDKVYRGLIAELGLSGEHHRKLSAQGTNQSRDSFIGL